VYRSDPTTQAGLRSRPAVDHHRASVTLCLCGPVSVVTSGTFAIHSL